jgi:hypothetical protein
MSLRYGVLCLLLFFVVLILFLKNYETWTLPIEVLPEKEATKKSGTKIEGSPSFGGQKEPTTPESYILIAEKNIFNPERKDFPVITPPVSELSKKPLVRPKIILYGVTFAGDYQTASIVNLGRPLQKGEREMMTLKVGDRIGEYQLAKILPDRVMMETPEDTFEVLLYDPKMPKKRVHTKTEAKPTTITSTLPASAPTPLEAPKPIPPREMMERPPERTVEPPVPRPSHPAISPTPPSSPAPMPSPRPRSRITPMGPTSSPPVGEGGEIKE